MARELDVGAVYDEHADFVWKNLHRLGVREGDLADLVQEVFVVVHRRRAEHDGARSVRGWLFGIAANVAKNHRRKAGRRGERLIDDADGRGTDADPEGDLDARRRRDRGLRALEELDPEKRAVFVMYEVEGLSCRAIAEALEIPLGTVHSRLHAARAELARALEEP